MILVTTGEASEQAFQQAIVFADQLNAAGFDAVLDGTNVPEIKHASTKFQGFPYLRDLETCDISQVIALGLEAEDLGNLNMLRHLELDSSVQVSGFGNFESRAQETNAKAQLNYAAGNAATLINLQNMFNIKAGTSICPCFGADITVRPPPFLRGKPAITIILNDLEPPYSIGNLQQLTSARTFKTLAYMSGASKTEWLQSGTPGDHVYQYSEITPAGLRRMSEVLVLTSSVDKNQNALCLLNNQLMSGGAIIDATQDGEFQNAGLPVQRGPSDLAYLEPYLSQTILPNLEGITQATRAASMTLGISLSEHLPDLPKEEPKAAQNEEPKIQFMPTNGHGLGHAQRCVLIGEDLRQQGQDAEFLAFPSCLPMINKAGFEATPLLPRSKLHKDSAANDLANYARLRTALSHRDVFIFDGGYVFDSVYRTILEKNLKAVWLRRGLWPRGQDNTQILDRQKYFNRVIEPMEAFDELNSNLSSGSQIHKIGPVTRQIDATAQSKEQLFSALRDQFNVPFEKLVVTMLGSGVLHDLSANVQTVCNAVEQDRTCLNLIVVWPSAVVPAQRYAWTQSRVVKTMRAGWLAAHADFVVSAVGYNSFHESMYNAVPTIFVPQVDTMLDDQEARAEAATKLGLAAHIPPAQLSQLDREVRQFLRGEKPDDIRQALKAYNFPERGNKQAAELIAELTQ